MAGVIGMGGIPRLATITGSIDSMCIDLAHIDLAPIDLVRRFFVQQLFLDENLQLEKVCGEVDPADLGTKM